jgi:DNA-binding transcriptional LysR family regulator
LKVLEQSSDQLVVWLAERKIDLMIGRFTDETQRTQFQYERLSSEPLLVVAGVHHPLRGVADLDMAELSHWPWILYPASTAVRRVTDDIFGRNGLTLVSGTVETPSFLFALEMMQTTDMLSLQPKALVERYFNRGLLTQIPIELPDRMPDYGMLTRLGEPLAPATHAFMEVLRQVAGRISEPDPT